ncbi:MAG: hypothetical protein IH594_00205 [Bacteroidales bacterium]|nr:hypothetical protein [Bacteroidales bacterium]
MLKMIRSNVAFRLFASIILVPLMIMPGGCYYYKINRTEAPYAPSIQKLQEEGRFIILHMDDNVWHFTNISVDGTQMAGTISQFSGHEMYKKATYDNPIRYRKSKTNNQSEVLNEVHIYVSELVVTDQGRLVISLDAVEKIDVYDPATGATIASWGLASLGTAAAVTGVIFIIVLLTKSSCPFIYIHDGTDYVFCGEVFSGAVQPGLERDDYFPLPAIAQKDKDYRIKMTNEVMEIQYADIAELIIVDHPSDKKVLFDKNGVPFFYNDPNPPVTVSISSNNEILKLVKEEDWVNCSRHENSADNKATEEAIFSFIRPENARHAKLVIKAKNSFWMEAVIAKIHAYFGSNYDKYMSKQENQSAEKLLKYQKEQEMPLSVYIKKNDTWEFIDYYNLAGPMALREDILSIDLSGIYSDTIEIKLKTGFGFWEIDRVGIDFSNQSTPEYLRLPLNNAIENNSKDVTALLTTHDSRSYVFAETGDEVSLSFINPEMKDEARSVFLHTRGYYKIVREQSGKPDRKTLRTFKQPGSVPAFSLETFNSIYHN